MDYTIYFRLAIYTLLVLAIIVLAIQAHQRKKAHAKELERATHEAYEQGKALSPSADTQALESEIEELRAKVDELNYFKLGYETSRIEIKKVMDMSANEKAYVGKYKYPHLALKDLRQKFNNASIITD